MKIDKEEMLAALAKEPDMVVATAYLYAVNMHRFGKDVTEKWLTAVENSIALDEAYVRGRIDSDNECKVRLDALLREIVENNEKCQKCVFYHPAFGKGVCFMASECVQKNFKNFKTSLEGEEVKE